MRWAGGISGMSRGASVGRGIVSNELRVVQQFNVVGWVIGRGP